MKATAIPTRFDTPFATSGTKNTIPTASQQSVTPGAASLTDGFPPDTFLDPASGGVPPFGADFNGILYMITAAAQWANAGGSYAYDSTYSSTIGGYPKGAILLSATGDSFWISKIDDNTVNPDSGPSVNWDAIWIENSVSTKTATATLTEANAGIVLVDATSASIVLTLPSAAVGYGFPLTIIRTDTTANTVTVQRAGTDTIQGTTSQTVTSLFPLSIASNGTGTWYFKSVPQSSLDGRYAALAGLSTQTFEVANAASSQEAVALGQAQGLFAALAGLSTQTFSVANAATASEAVALGQSLAGATVNAVTGSRAAGTTYTNSHSRAMFVMITFTASTAGGYMDLDADQIYNISATSVYQNWGVLVPPGHTYKLQITGTISNWIEVY